MCTCTPLSFLFVTYYGVTTNCHVGVRQNVDIYHPSRYVHVVSPSLMMSMALVYICMYIHVHLVHVFTGLHVLKLHDMHSNVLSLLVD